MITFSIALITQVTFHGALAAASATAVGHFPWFFTYNTLQVTYIFYPYDLSNGILSIFV